jgi:hypothetical protein
MSRKAQLIAQAFLTAVQSVVPSLEGLSLGTRTMIHAVLGAFQMMLGALAQGYNTDGTPQQVAYVPPTEVVLVKKAEEPVVATEEMKK